MLHDLFFFLWGRYLCNSTDLYIIVEDSNNATAAIITTTRWRTPHYPVLMPNPSCIEPLVTIQRIQDRDQEFRTDIRDSSYAAFLFLQFGLTPRMVIVQD